MAAEPRFPPPDPRDVDPRAVRRAFARAAATYDAAAVLQREVGTRMAAAPRLRQARAARRSSTRAAARARRSASSPRAMPARASSRSMSRCRWSRRRANARGAPASLLRRLLPDALGGGHAAPLLRLRRHERAAAARRRVRPRLEQPGAAVGQRPAARVRGVRAACSRSAGSSRSRRSVPTRCSEIRSAFARADGYTHTNRFIDMHDLGDMLVHAGFADPVMDMEQITLTYADAGRAAARAEARSARPTRRAAARTGSWAAAAGSGCWRRSKRCAATAAFPRRSRSSTATRGRASPSARAEGPPDRQARAAEGARSDGPRNLRHRHRYRRRQDAWPPSRCCARSRASGIRAAGMKPLPPASTPGAIGQRRRRRAAAGRRCSTFPLRDRNPYAFVPADRAASRRARRGGADRSRGHRGGLCALARGRRRRRRRRRGRRARSARAAARHARHRARLRLPVLLVVGMRLGCLNHALLSRGRDRRARPAARGLGRESHRPADAARATTTSPSCERTAGCAADRRFAWGAPSIGGRRIGGARAWRSGSSLPGRIGWPDRAVRMLRFCALQHSCGKCRDRLDVERCHSRRSSPTPISAWSRAGTIRLRGGSGGRSSRRWRR